MKQPIILFDIDGTLINYHRLAGLRRQRFFGNVLRGRLVHELKAWDLLAATPAGQADPALFVGSMFDAALIRQSLYTDVLPTLRALSRRANLGVWSQANAKQQHLKLEAAGIKDLFAPELLLISSRKRRALREFLTSKPQQHIIIVDNEPRMLRGFAGGNVRTFHIHRGGDSMPSSIPTLQALLAQIE